MQHIKRLILLVFILLSLDSSAQKLDNLLNAHLELTQNWPQAHLIWKDSTVDAEYILQKAEAYYNHPNEKSRSNAYGLTFEAFRRMEVEASKFVEFLLKFPCQDEYKRTRIGYSGMLTKFNPSAFNEESIKLFKEILYDDDLVTYYIVQIAGYLNLTEEKERIRDFLDIDDLKYRSGSKNWSAQLALARMGEQQYVDSIMNYVQPQKLYKLAALNLNYLSYIQQDEATKVIVEVLMNEDKYNPLGHNTSCDKETIIMLDYGGVDTYSLWAAGVLGLILEDAPIDVKNADITHEQLKIFRDWIRDRDKNKPWSYNRAVFWSKRGEQ